MMDKKKKLIESYYKSGDICGKFNNCVLLHSIAAGVVEGENNELALLENLDPNNNEEQWAHMDSLVFQWRNELKSILTNEKVDDEERLKRKQKRSNRNKFVCGKW